MPIIIQKDIPAYELLEKENIFVMNKARAAAQDIRAIRIAILNLMPTKIETETQLIRLLANTPLQVEVTFIATESYKSTHVSEDHMGRFYKNFKDVKNDKFDGMIITGAPVETLDFEQVKYWDELTEIMDYAEKNVTSTIYICWGAQAALYHYYKIPKYNLEEKKFGVFKNRKLVYFEVLLNGIDDVFYIPHSRHTEVRRSDVDKIPELVSLTESNEAGLGIIKTIDNSKIFITGHLEYDKYTLRDEYLRDKSKGLPIKEPINYFNNGDVDVLWRSTANILFYNWLNYYVYQVTPFDFKNREIQKKE